MPYGIGEKCIGCTACARLCPVSAINGEKGKRHEINPLRCVECGVCGRLCPSGAVNDAGGNACVAVKRALWLKPRISYGESVEPGLCSACGICVQDCAPHALSISLPKFRGDIRVYAELSAPQKCIGCALCERHCPQGAIAMIVPQAATTEAAGRPA